MATYVVSDGEDYQQFLTEKEAVWTFCEMLLDDAIKARPDYPRGTVLSLTKDGEPIIRYTVGYENAPER